MATRTLSRAATIARRRQPQRDMRNAERAISSHLVQMLQELAPIERKVLRRLVQDADLIEAADRLWLLTPVTPRMLDVLAEFEAANEDLEPDDLEKDECDDA